MNVLTEGVVLERSVVFKILLHETFCRFPIQVLTKLLPNFLVNDRLCLNLETVRCHEDKRWLVMRMVLRELTHFTLI